MTEKLYHFIGGQRVDGTSGRFGDVFNPATGEVRSQVPYANANDVDQAVQSAVKAFETWSKMSAPRRSQVMFSFRELLIASMDELAFGGQTSTGEGGCISLEVGEGSYIVQVGDRIKSGDVLVLVEPVEVTAGKTAHLSFNLPEGGDSN